MLLLVLYEACMAFVVDDDMHYCISMPYGMQFQIHDATEVKLYIKGYFTPLEQQKLSEKSIFSAPKKEAFLFLPPSKD